jgi:hypothetical protein
VGQRKPRSQGEGLRPDLKGRVRSDLCSVKVLLAALVNRFVWLDAGKGGPGWLWDKREVDGFNRSLGSMLKGLRGGRRWRGVTEARRSNPVPHHVRKGSSIAAPQLRGNVLE